MDTRIFISQYDGLIFDVSFGTVTIPMVLHLTTTTSHAHGLAAGAGRA